MTASGEGLTLIIGIPLIGFCGLMYFSAFKGSGPIGKVFMAVTTSICLWVALFYDGPRNDPAYGWVLIFVYYPLGVYSLCIGFFSFMGGSPSSDFSHESMNHDQGRSRKTTKNSTKSYNKERRQSRQGKSIQKKS